MNYQYKRLAFQAPKSYEELTNNRPTKKRNYNYTSQQDSGLQNINIPISSLKSQDKDFSFQNSQSQSFKKTQNKSYEVYQNKQEFSPIHSKDMLQSEPQSPLNEKYIDQRLNNIDSISLKINSILSHNKQRKPTLSTPLAEKGTNIDKYTIKQSSLNESVKSSSNQTQKDKSIKPKYSYVPNEEDPIASKVSFAEKKYQPQNIVREDFRKKNLMSPLQILKVSQSENPKDQISQTSSFKANHNRRPSYYASQFIDRDKIKQEIQTELQVNLKKQKILSKNQQLDLKIDSIKHKMLDNSPLFNKNVQIQDRIVEIEPYSQTLQVTKVANKLSKHIEIDIILLKIREAFESSKQPNKWQKLKTQLQARNIYLEQKQLLEAIAITIQQKNPFATKPQYPLNGFKDLAKLYAESCRIWFEEIEKCVSLDGLAREDFTLSSIDLNHKGFINLQDLVCFVNVNSQKFYRSRDVLPLFKRFLKLQGKTIQKGSGQGITYGTFMQKIAQ